MWNWLWSRMSDPILQFLYIMVTVGRLSWPFDGPLYLLFRSHSYFIHPITNQRKGSKSGKSFLQELNLLWKLRKLPIYYPTFQSWHMFVFRLNWRGRLLSQQSLPKQWNVPQPSKRLQLWLFPRILTTKLWRYDNLYVSLSGLPFLPQLVATAMPSP